MRSILNISRPVDDSPVVLGVGARTQGWTFWRGPRHIGIKENWELSVLLYDRALGSGKLPKTGCAPCAPGWGRVSALLLGVRG